jgi:hypothetical protein
MAYQLEYRTFDELMADVRADLPKYDQNDLISPHQLIKVARKVSWDLGLRIYRTKEALLEVEKGRVRLPNDFYVLSYAFVCGEHTSKVTLPQGTHIEERRVGDVIPEYQWVPGSVDTCRAPEEPLDPCCPTCQSASPCGCDTCPPNPTVCLNCKGDEWEIVQVIKSQTRTYKTFFPLVIKDGSQDIECGCPNLYMEGENTAYIKDGWLYTNFKKGKVYIKYEGMLEDEQGNILVPNHELLNEYYEYALKDRLLENMFLGDIAGAGPKIQLVATKLHRARIAAKSYVNMPNFKELKDVYDKNRKAQYSKYYDMFAGLSWTSFRNTPHHRTNFTRRG